MREIASESGSFVGGEVAERLLRHYESDILDPFHRSLPFWRYSNESLAYALLATFDSMLIPFLVTGPNFDFLGPVQLYKNLVEGLNQAFRWLASRDATPGLQPSDARELINDAGEFLLHAGKYVDIADLHISLNRGLVTAAVDAERKVVRFSYSSHSDGLDASYGFVEDCHLLKVLSRGYEASSSLRAAFCGAVQVFTAVPYSLESGRIRITDVKPLNSERLRAYTESHYPFGHDELSGAQDLSGFTIDEYTAFWDAFRRWSHCAIHLFITNLFRGVEQNRCYPTPDLLTYPTIMLYL